MTPLEQLLIQRYQLQAQIGALVGLGAGISLSEAALLKAYRRQLQSMNAQIIILENEPPELPVNPMDDIPF